MPVGCVEKLLQRAQLRNVRCQKLLITLLRLADRIDNRWPFTQVDFVSFAHTKILGIYFHIHPLGDAGSMNRVCAYVHLWGSPFRISPSACFQSSTARPSWRPRCSYSS